MSIDDNIISGLVAGKLPEDIAAELLIPVDWVLEMQGNMPKANVAVIDLPKQYGMN